jgi:hypothetical protein
MVMQGLSFYLFQFCFDLFIFPAETASLREQTEMHSDWTGKSENRLGMLAD